MGQHLKQYFHSAVQHLPGWLFLVGGIAIIALTVLMPTRQQMVELNGKLRLMRQQARQMGIQETAYKRFHLALRTDDPILLQRLAYHHLRLKPAGTDSFDDPTESTPTIEAMLHAPMPTVSANEAQRSPSRLIRLTCGNNRLAVLAAGLLCVFAGMLMPIDKSGTKR